MSSYALGVVMRCQEVVMGCNRLSGGCHVREALYGLSGSCQRGYQGKIFLPL